jgi:hypothetical protein
MKFFSVSILSVIWVVYSYVSIAGNFSLDDLNKGTKSCHRESTAITTDTKDCCTKFDKKETNCEKQNKDTEKSDDCCKTSHCPRTCCQTFIIHNYLPGDLAFGYLYVKPVFGLHYTNQLPEPFLGIVPPPPNMLLI